MGMLNQYHCPNCQQVVIVKVINSEHHRMEIKKKLECPDCKYRWNVSQEKPIVAATN